MARDDLQDGPSVTIPELLERIDYDPREAARSIAINVAMIGLGVVLGAVFTALAVGQVMDPVGAVSAGTVEQHSPQAYSLTVADLVRARDYVALVGLGGFLAGAIALGALESEWF